MKVNKPSTLEVTGIALGGKALARDDGRVIFVDRGLPGDRIEARLTRSKKTWAEARLERVLTPSPLRVAPLCPHLEYCGGCRFQDLRYDEQLKIKRAQVTEALEHIGGLVAPIVHEIVAAPATFHYRNKMEFSFAPANDPAGAPLLGLHVRGDFERVFALRECFLPSGLTVEVVRFTQTFAAEHGWLAYHPARHTGVVRFLTVRHLPHTDQCAVQLIAARDEVPGLGEWAQGVAALGRAVRTVTLGLNASRANVAFAEAERVLVGDGTIVERLLGLEFEATSNAFLQTNSGQAEALYAKAIEAARLSGDECVLDLYSGTGTLTLLFARAAREAIGVESVTAAVDRARANATRNGIANARFVCGESRAVLREWARGERPDAPKPDVVVVDPPRAGLHPRVVARVAELKPRRIVYVSCNPATLARDLKDFATGGYTFAEATPFDMFPHTPHIECVARLEPRSEAAASARAAAPPG